MTFQVSTASMYAIPRNAVLDLQSRIVKAETEMTTGQLANPAESLGSQFGIHLSLRAQSSNLEAIQSSNTIVQSSMSASQNALTSIASDAQNFINAIITAKNTKDVSSLQTQAQAFLNSFTSLLNSSSGSAFVFGGTNSTVQPLSDYAGAPKAATAAAFQAAFGMSQSSSQVSTISSSAMQSFLTGSFANLFTGASWSTNWSKASDTGTSALISPGNVVTTSVTANASGFQKLASAYTSIMDLSLGNLNSATQEVVLSNALTQASAGLQGINGLQTTLGISQSLVTNANDQMQTQASLIDKWAGQLVAVDPYEAASRLTNLQTQLETAYSLTNRIAKLSLVNYLTA